MFGLKKRYSFLLNPYPYNIDQQKLANQQNCPTLFLYLHYSNFIQLKKII